MKKYHLSTIGTFHINHNEDTYVITELSSTKTLLAVMDGCSMGKESHFASTLIAKILRKIAKEISYKTFATKTSKSPKENLEEILQQLFDELILIKDQLQLEKEEILSTLILGIFDHQQNEVELITIGDGLIYYDGNKVEYEQDDKPDYLGYHLTEDFDDWFQNQHQKLSLKNVSDLSISTDGIFTFKQFDNKEYEPINEYEIIDYLLMNQEWSDEENMLHRKLVVIENLFGLKASDDLTILRVKQSLSRNPVGGDILVTR